MMQSPAPLPFSKKRPRPRASHRIHIPDVIGYDQVRALALKYRDAAWAGNSPKARPAGGVHLTGCPYKEHRAVGRADVLNQSGRDKVLSDRLSISTIWKPRPAPRVSEGFKHSRIPSPSLPSPDKLTKVQVLFDTELIWTKIWTYFSYAARDRRVLERTNRPSGPLLSEQHSRSIENKKMPETDDGAKGRI